MSTAEISYTQSKTLNLLLKHQIITQIDNSEDTRKDEIFNFHHAINLNEQETLNKFPAKITYNDNSFDKCDDIKIQLSNIQLEESSSIEHQKTLDESYDLLENLLDHILQHVECVILEIKTSNKLSLILKNFVTQEPQQENFKFDNTYDELTEVEILQDIKSKLYVALNNFEKITEMRQEYECKTRDYYLALKNFKIILEVMNINDKCLEKLKQQFHDVVLGYRHCRSVLEQKMPYIIAERTKVLAECLIRLGEGCKKFVANKMDLIEVMTNLGTELNNSHYMVIKENIFK